jgi:hypothetical protein
MVISIYKVCLIVIGSSFSISSFEPKILFIHVWICYIMKMNTVVLLCQVWGEKSHIA